MKIEVIEALEPLVMEGSYLRDVCFAEQERRVMQKLEALSRGYFFVVIINNEVIKVNYSSLGNDGSISSTSRFYSSLIKDLIPKYVAERHGDDSVVTVGKIPLS